MSTETESLANILIVDDSRTVLALTQHLLKDAGYRVTTCENPILVPSLIFRDQIDLVLLDVQMPGLSGEWVAETVRQDVRGAKTQIIFHSSEEEERLAELKEATGAAGYFRKRGNPEALLTLIRSVLEAREEA